MADRAAKPAPVPGYLMVNSNQKARLFPPHGYTIRTLALTRFHENTSAIALTIGLLLPMLNGTHRELEQKIEQAAPLELEDVKTIVKHVGTTTSLQFADTLCRVAVQTATCSLLIKAHTPHADSVVLLCDIYPRLHAKYLGDFLQKMCIPRYFASLVGKLPTATDLEVFTQNISPLAALEDSAKRNTVLLIGDVVVDAARMLPSLKTSHRREELVKKVMLHLTSFTCKVLGASVGRAAGGSTGEYWGEILSQAVAPLVYTAVSHMASGGGSRARVKPRPVSAAQQVSTQPPVPERLSKSTAPAKKSTAPEVASRRARA